MTMPALFAVETGASVKQVQPPVIQGKRKDDTFLSVNSFLSDPEVPFTNNIAEQAVRMPKVKQMISGCFRIFDGAAAFCTTRSYLETLRKQGVDLLHALVHSFQGVTSQPATG